MLGLEVPPCLNPLEGQQLQDRRHTQSATNMSKWCRDASARQCDRYLFFDQDQDLWLTTHRMKLTPHSGQLVFATATLLPHDADILKPRCMSQFLHHKPQQRLNLRVPPRYDLHQNKKLLHARLTTRARRTCNRFGTPVPLAKQQNMFQSRSMPCFKHTMRNTTRAQLKCATPI